MFDMQLPWWEFIVRGAIIYSVLLLMVRISGRRTVGQFRPFDLLVVMLLSESVSNSLSGSDESVSGGLIVAATLIALNTLVAAATARSRKLATLVDGTPILLGRDGQIFHDARRSARITEGDIEQALHEADCTLEDVQYIFLESDGGISILQKKSAEPGKP
ncbi:DUF421 domain-containing protein [Noviherbaspirillum sp. CPCC 100848]|uniref:DUF421 domain-containing protein n=1 Tax=Noviherbaspirillum album TaxID=3080276 RepID=A0ABU6JDS7_9BURK|nr:YetF domain-containing protein [Noviherbaspirillum sp. CPCC 100848]MEC4721611.1 DUF421 domain-containing protein [Noviherbaspirillum sp. CPCC 100848]